MRSPMQVQVRLVHAEPGARVVQATAVQAGNPCGSALGEGPTAEEAEDRARQRLRSFLGPTPAVPAPPPPSQISEATATPLAGGWAGPPGARQDVPRAQQPAEASEEPQVPAELGEFPVEQPQSDPEDWSAELARIDLELRRLGWQRPQESTFLQRAFGHPSRSRITTYADLQIYLHALEHLQPGSDPASVAVPLRRSDLLKQSEVLLSQLGWDAAAGRRALERRFGCSSRQQLSDAQLLQFNMLLEEELMDPGQSG